MLEESIFSSNISKAEETCQQAEKVKNFFSSCGLLLLCTFCILSCLCILVYLQRTLGKPTHTGVFLCGKEIQEQPWTEAIFAKKQQNLHLGVLIVCYHSPRSSKGIQLLKRHALFKSILVLNTLGGFKRLQINPYQADSENLQ